MTTFEFHVYSTGKGTKKIQRNIVGENKWETIGASKEIEITEKELIEILNTDGTENAFDNYMRLVKPVTKKIVGELDFEGMSASLVITRFESKASENGWEDFEIEKVLDEATQGNYQHMIDTLSKYFVKKQEKKPVIKELRKGEYYIGDIKTKIEESLYNSINDLAEKDGKDFGIVEYNGENIGYVSIDGKENFNVLDFSGTVIPVESLGSNFIFIIGSSDFHLHSVKESCIHSFEANFKIEEEDGIVFIGDIEVQFEYEEKAEEE